MANLTTKCLLLAGAMTFALNAKAQDAAKEPALSISGNADAYFRYSSIKGASLTSFTDKHNSFSLGMANVQFSKDNGKVGFMADIAIGQRAEQFSYGYEGSLLSAIKQMYVTYKPTEKVKFTLGSFATFVGYELAEATNNLNYSMSYNFTNGPFYHTGLKVDYAINANWTAMLGVFDKTDTKFDGGKKFVGGQLGYVKDKWKIYLNGLTGNLDDSLKTQVTTLDLTASYQATSKLGLGLNVLDKISKPSDVEAVSWTGIAAYANYAFSDKFVLAGRGEYMIDNDGALYAGDNNITAFTLSGNIKFGALTLIPEVRFDSAKQGILPTNTGTAEKTAASFIVAAAYKF